MHRGLAVEELPGEWMPWARVDALTVLAVHPAAGAELARHAPSLTVHAAGLQLAFQGL